jgi:DNA helicase II / ATP-dependent DNA helicase PcrA
VGVTRAQDKLVLTHARRRRRGRDVQDGRRSPFVEAIPLSLLQLGRSPRLHTGYRTGFGEGRGRGLGGRFGREDWDDLPWGDEEGMKEGVGRGERGGRHEPWGEAFGGASAGESTGTFDGGTRHSLEETEMNQDLPRFVKGERVAHPTFGSGTVVEASGSGRDLKVTVLFESVGRKKLLARYANLEKDYY